MAVNIENDSLFSEIQRLKHDIKHSARLCEPLGKHTFCVLKLERYLVDPTFQSFFKAKYPTNSSHDVYDVTITDRVFKLKCVLSTVLNSLVQQGKILVGSVIKLTECFLLYDETDLDGFNFVVVEKLELDENDNTEISLNEETISWSSDSCLREQEEIPLASARGCYVFLWSSFETYGTVWEQTVPVCQSVSSETVEDSYTLKELFRHWRSLKASSLPAVIVRVLTKTRLRQYAKPHKADKWPYQISMVIGDKSGSCTAVIWNSLCAKLNKSIRAGSVLLLENYTVKAHFNAYTYQQNPRVNKQSHYDIDLNLNPHHPVSRVSVLQESDVQADWELPSLEYEFITRKQLGKLPDNFICDVVGVIKNIGRYERVAPQNSENQGFNSWWVIRWVQLIDQYSAETGKAFYVKLFRSIQGDTLDRLFPGDVLLCTHLRVVSNVAQVQDSRHSHQVYLTSTGETQVTIIGRNTTDFNHANIKGLKRWAQSSQGQEAIREAVIGGYFTYPSLPLDLNLYKKLYTEKNPMQITASDQWKSVLGSLSYRESRNLVVQANVGRICHHVLKSASSRSTNVVNQATDLEFTETVIYESNDCTQQDITVLGSTEIIAETQPCTFCRQNKEILLRKIAFPPCVYSSRGQNSDTPLAVQPKSSYYSITLMGLNHRVALHTIYPHESSGFVDQIVGSTTKVSHSKRPKGSHQKKSASPTTHRCLCHIDLHQVDKDTTEIILNAAYLLH